MPSEVFRRLTASKLELADIEDVISWHFRHSRFLDDRVEFSHGAFLPEQPALTLLLDKDRKLRDVEIGPGLRANDIKTIEASLQHLVATSKLFHVRRHMFSDTPVRGAYRYRDEFQIVPIQRGAPEPVELNAKWPFVLEFTYLGAEHHAIDHRRCAAATSKLVSLLNAIADAHILPVAREGEKDWVMNAQGDCAYLQKGYTFPVPSGRGFLDTREMPRIRQIPAAAYYRGETDSFRGFSWPDDIDEMLDNYHAMSEGDRDKFDVAAHWYGRHSELARISESAGLVALVTALEAIAPSAEDHACPKCGHIGGVIRGFRVLLDEAVPGHEEGKYQFYKLRSRLAHGSSLLLTEFGGMGGGSAAHMQNFSQYELQNVVRLALRNWLIPEVRQRIDQIAGLRPHP